MNNPLTSPAYVKELMRRHGFTFSKALGQNFLINGAIPAKIADAAGIGPETGVIEIGPGFGTLTWELCPGGPGRWPPWSWTDGCRRTARDAAGL